MSPLCLLSPACESETPVLVSPEECSLSAESSESDYIHYIYSVIIIYISVQ